ncbi:probable potassium transporter 17 isoform X2 [Dendrobium catenatum]|uniref:probable potassium transporter 17 isoform X2 n=1 Tax=Dendrobium catenatum TaxID=906689 RepID=UPI00109F33B8|nr:probable potassium transporter 17 isoform X2 [Dendrobium catenatum]
MDVEVGGDGESPATGKCFARCLPRETSNSSFRRDFILAYKTLGVVFGGLVTSPLYVYPSMNLESPTEEDYLGIYSIMFWTLTLIGVVKYICIALNADDNGEETRNKLGKFLEKNIIAQRIVLFIAMSGVCMLIGDGILTPAISVLSAIEGLRGPFPSVSKVVVEGLSVAVLLALFLLQKHGTSRVSFLFSPIMGAWTFTTPIIGLYSLLKYYPSIFKALSPHYIVHFFLRNKSKGWQLLGGTILCITGAEAMFADLGHFNKRSIQMAFLLTIYPSLILTYAGQTAYLIRHLNDHSDGFYKFVPHVVYWPMFIIATLAAIVASQSLISASFSVIKQSLQLDYFPRVRIIHTSQNKEGEVYSPETNYILMVLCVLIILYFGDGKDIGNAFGVVVILVMLITTILLTIVMIIIWRTPIIIAMLYFVPFFIMEGVYTSAVFTKIPQGGWIPFVISIILASVMFSWHYGRQRKLEYEMKNKIPIDCLNELLSRPEIQRVAGICFFYNKIEDGITPLFGHYLKTMRSLHKVTIFITLRYMLVAKVDSNERIIIRKLGIDGVYECVIHCGFADSISLERDHFFTEIRDSLEQHIKMNSGEFSRHIEEENSELENAKKDGVVHVRGKANFHISKSTSLFDKILLGFYQFLHGNCRSALPNMGIPLHQRVEFGMLYET